MITGIGATREVQLKLRWQAWQIFKYIAIILGNLAGIIIFFNVIGEVVLIL